MKFNEEVYFLCKKIPSGKVTTYKEIAHALHSKAYQAVGNALRKNPYAPLVPCHRVIQSNGKIGGFRGKLFGSEVVTKVDILLREGVIIKKGKIDLKKFLFRF